MRRAHRSVVGRAAIVMAVCSIAAGCGGTSGSTSRADAVAVARAEHAFIKAWGEATAQAERRCEATGIKNPERCFSLAFSRAARSAVADFTNAMEGVMAKGVGSGCAAAVEESLAEPSQIPYFPAGASAACLAESRDD